MYHNVLLSKLCTSIANFFLQINFICQVVDKVFVVVYIFI